jgi:hypothetical protein
MRRVGWVVSSRFSCLALSRSREKGHNLAPCWSSREARIGTEIAAGLKQIGCCLKSKQWTFKLPGWTQLKGTFRESPRHGPTSSGRSQSIPSVKYVHTYIHTYLQTCISSHCRPRRDTNPLGNWDKTTVRKIKRRYDPPLSHNLAPSTSPWQGDAVPIQFSLLILP